MVRVLNMAAGVASIMFPGVPVLPGDVLDKGQGILDTLAKKSSVEDYACLQEALHTDHGGKGGNKTEGTAKHQVISSPQHDIGVSCTYTVAADEQKPVSPSVTRCQLQAMMLGTAFAAFVLLHQHTQCDGAVAVATQQRCSIWHVLLRTPRLVTFTGLSSSVFCDHDSCF